MLADLLDENAERLGGRTALVYGVERLSHAELAELVRQLAAGLASVGVEQGDRVILMLPNIPEWPVSFFALAALGAGAVLLDPQSKEHELSHAFLDCRPSVVITNPQGAERWRAVAERLEQQVVVISVGAAPRGAISVRDVVAAEGDTALPWPSADEPVMYQYSSGSTGRPKRVGRTHEQCAAEADLVTETFGLTEDDTILCAVPLYHAYGLGDCLFAAVGSGATLVIQPHPRPFAVKREHTLELLEQEHVTIFPAVPYMAELLATAPRDANLSGLRYCVSAGNVLPFPVFAAFHEQFGVPVRQLYGCTETPSIAVNLDPDPRPTAGSVGQPMSRVEVAVYDEDGVSQATGVVGEIGVRSPAGATGYVTEEAADRRTFRDGWVFPGDLGFLDDERRLTVAGRTKIFIEVHGHKVDPLEVEDLIALHPAVEEVVVVGSQLEKARGEVVKAAVVPRAPCTERELIRFCSERLAAFKVPRIVEFRESIPRSPLGKVLRKELI